MFKDLSDIVDGQVDHQMWNVSNRANSSVGLARITAGLLSSLYNRCSDDNEAWYTPSMSLLLYFEAI